MTSPAAPLDVLLLEGDIGLANVVVRVLGKRVANVRQTNHPSLAWLAIREHTPDLVVADCDLGFGWLGQASETLLRQIAKEYPAVRRILWTHEARARQRFVEIGLVHEAIDKDEGLDALVRAVALSCRPAGGNP